MRHVRTILLVAVVLGAVSAPAFAQSADPSAAVFDDTVVHEIRLYINSIDWQQLQANWQADDHYPADFKWNGHVVRNVSMRSHGAGSQQDEFQNRVQPLHDRPDTARPRGHPPSQQLAGSHQHARTHGHAAVPHARNPR